MNFNYIFPNFMVFFSMLLVVGFSTSNKVIFIIGILGILMFSLGIFIEMPNGIYIKRIKGKREIKTNTVFTNEIEIVIERGFGVVYLADVLPEDLELVDGSNYMVLFKGLKPLTVTMSYKVRAENACVVTLKSFYYESRHFLELLRVEEKKITTPQTLTFSPVASQFKDVRNISILAKLFNYQFARSSVGLPTMDFKQLKAYTAGDSIKYINWRATARNINALGEYYPIVNEYEKEGMYNVWFLLDFSKNMLYGSNLKNMINYSIDTMINLVEYYLRKNANIAFTGFNGYENFLYPNTGKNQYYKFIRETKNITQIIRNYNDVFKDESLDLKETVFKYNKYFNGTSPFFVIFTRVIPDNLDSTIEGIRECFKYIPKTANKKLPIMVVNLNGHIARSKKLHGEELTLEFLKMRDKHLVKKAFKRNIIWIDWDPFNQEFFETLSRTLQVI